MKNKFEQRQLGLKSVNIITTNILFDEHGFNFIRSFLNAFISFSSLLIFLSIRLLQYASSVYCSAFSISLIFVMLRQWIFSEIQITFSVLCAECLSVRGRKRRRWHKIMRTKYGKKKQQQQQNTIWTHTNNQRMKNKYYITYDKYIFHFFTIQMEYGTHKQSTCAACASFVYMHTTQNTQFKKEVMKKHVMNSHSKWNEMKWKIKHQQHSSKSREN